MFIQEINMLPPEEMAAERQNAFSKEQNYFIFPHRLAGGEERIMEVYSSPVDWKGKQVLFSIIHDVTEIKRAEEAHSKSEAMLQKVQEVTHMGSWEIDLNTRTVIGSDEAHRIYGIAQGSMTLDYIQSVPLLEFRPILDAALSALITEGKRYDVEFKIKRQSDGAIRDIHSIAEYNASNRTMIGSVQDITERKRAEDALKKSEIWFKSLFEKASEGIFYLSIDGELVEVNDAFARMHGYTVEEMLKMKLSDLDTPETSRQFPERMRRIVAGEIFTFEVEHFHKDGHAFPLEVTTSMIAVGDERYVLAFHRDITERRQGEKALRESEALYRQAFEVAGTVPYLQSYTGRDKELLYDFIGEGIRKITGYGPEEFNVDLWDSLT
jgi:PAS domain S-box-containing protein